MKRLLSLTVCLGLAFGAYAQGLGNRLADTDFDIELGNSQFYVAPVSYFHFGFNGLTQTDSDFAGSTRFLRSQQLGINVVELAVRPSEALRFSLGADFRANWYRLNKNFMWYPYDPGIMNGENVKENGYCAGFGPFRPDIQGVSRSTLSVLGLAFPLTFSYKFGQLTFALGAAVELNFNGVIRFKGVDYAGKPLNCTSSGKYFSNQIFTNRVTFDIHAAVSFGGLGLFAQFSPLPKFYQGIHNGKEVICGPQFQTWCVGLILGLGM